jgi:hypothetical protein
MIATWPLGRGLLSLGVRRLCDSFLGGSDGHDIMDTPGVYWRASGKRGESRSKRIIKMGVKSRQGLGGGKQSVEFRSPGLCHVCHVHTISARTQRKNTGLINLIGHIATPDFGSSQPDQ